MTDGLGGTYTTGINLVSKSQPGSDALFVGISGTPLDPTAGCYTVTLKSVLKSTSNNCTKTVVHTTCENNCKQCAGDSSNDRRNGTYSVGGWQGDVVIATNLPWVAGYANIVALDSDTATILQQGYYIKIDGNSGDIAVSFLAGSGSALNIKWEASKSTS